MSTAGSESIRLAHRWIGIILVKREHRDSHGMCCQPQGFGGCWASLAAIPKATTTLALPYNTQKSKVLLQSTARHKQQQQHFSRKHSAATFRQLGPIAQQVLFNSFVEPILSVVLTASSFGQAQIDTTEAQTTLLYSVPSVDMARLVSFKRLIGCQYVNHHKSLPHAVGLLKSTIAS